MGLAPKVLGIIFFPLVWIYTLVIYLRNKFYDHGWFKSCAVNASVISVGNVQMGGTGKTPFVEYIAHKLLATHRQPVILTRGYRRQSSQPVLLDESNRDKITAKSVGDEPFLLSQNLPSVKIGVDADRCRMAQKIIQKYPQTVFLLDDGFQHRRMPRQLDIVLIDVSRWSRIPLLFPLTYFRDVKSSLRRAHLFVLTRTGGLNERADQIKTYLQKKYGAPAITAELQPHFLQSVKGAEQLPLEKLSGKKVAAFCGLANPDQFFGMLKANGAEVIREKNFSDHYYYIHTDVTEISRAAQEAGAEMVVTTQKDAVKLLPLINDEDEKYFYLKINLHVEDEKQLDELVRKKIRLR